MLDVLYLVCIAPLEFCMRHILEWGFDLTHSYGLALIFMSLAVNTVILPIYNKVEGWQEEERALKARMAPMEAMIREVFKGQERFAMISTLYRQHGYSQFMTLRASVGVLLQIPFFFAAYHLLSNMEALHGVSFGPIRDLGAPDALFAIGGMSINVLPILMTVVNLVSAFFYTHDLSRRDKVQLYGMAALFLVLLYNSPAALTFYWTLNNVYSLGKNIVEKDWMKRKGWEKFEGKFAGAWARLGQKTVALCALGAHILGMQVRLSIVTGIVGVTALFMLMLGLSNRQEYFFKMNTSLFAACLLFAVFILLTIICFYFKKRFAHSKHLSCIQALIVLAVIVGCTYIFAKHGFYQGKANKVITKMAVVGVIIFAFIYGKMLWRKIHDKVFAQKKELEALFLPAAGLLAFLIFVYCPFMVFSSDPLVFNLKLEDFASSRFGTFFVIMIALAVIHALVRPVRWAFGAIFATITIASLTFCFVIAPDVGIMDTFILQKPEVLEHWYNIILDIIAIGSAILISVTSIYFYKIQILKSIAYASISTLIIMTGIHYNDAKYTLSQITVDDIDNISPNDKLQTGIQIPQYVNNFFTFSNNGKNIVVVVLDMFTGGHMNQILDMHPELKEELDGFTWYEDTITAGSNTFYGNSCILSGKKAHPYILSSTDDSRSLEEKINELRGHFLRSLQEKNFRLSVHEITLFDIDLTKKYLTENSSDIFRKSYALWSDAGRYWGKKYNVNKFDVQSYDKFLYILGLYNISPISYRKSLYQKGLWKKTISRGTDAFKMSILDLGNLEICSDASRIQSNIDNSFIYFVSQLPHRPWTLDEKGMPTDIAADLESRDWKNSGLSIAHIRTEYASLKKMIDWFKWMKNNGVYDNTQIILVSDHGMGDSAGVVKTLGYVPDLHPHGLMLVKNFGQRGPLLIDRTSHMANWDVPTLINNGLAQKQEDIKQEWANSKRIRPHSMGHAFREKNYKEKYRIDTTYQIQGSLYDINSWKPTPKKEDPPK